LHNERQGFVMSSALGLRFRKLDLHTHTPASKCYKYPDHTPDEIVQAAIDKSLDAIAITDHNSAGWVDKMRAAVQDKPLVIFPGVEISTHEGYHVVVLFDPLTPQKEIELFLGELKFAEEQLGRSDELCRVSIDELIKCAHERKALVVLAHIDGFKGAFSVLTEKDQATGKVKIPNTCTDLFNNPYYDAIEVVNGKLPESFEAARGFKRFPAFYQSSDNPDPEQPTKHSKDGLAERYTWFKLDEITLEGLRQCFADPTVRIRQMHQDLPSEWPHIISLKVGGNGFLANQELAFHPGLNSLIGGKGAGKSLAIEFLRFALGQPSQDGDIRADHVGKLDDRLGAMTSVELEFVTETGAHYTLKRTYQGTGSSDVLCAHATTGEKYEGDIPQLFPVLAYSQTEVIKIAEAPEAQLRLVDSLIDTRPFQREIESLQNSLKKNDQDIAEALSAREKVDGLKVDIATYEATIAAINAKLNSPLQASMRAADAKKAVLSNQQSYIDQLAALLKRVNDDIAKLALPSVSLELTDDRLLNENLAKLQIAQKATLDALAEIISNLNNSQVAMANAVKSWLPEYDQVRQAYEAELAGTDLARLEVDRRRQVDAKAEAERALTDNLHLVQDILPTLQQERTNLLDRLDQQYQAYFAARSAKFEELSQASNSRLKLELKHAVNREAYAKAIRDFWKGTGPYSVSTDNRQKMADNILPRQLVDSIIARDAPGLAHVAGFTQDTAEKVIQKAWHSDDFAEVLALQHAYYPEDEPSIQFNKGNNRYAPLHELSVGQKCTALLIIALCDGAMPVIIDQPEDALDIASVWNDIAVKLRSGKENRQFILTTHNSTIAVGSDSDNFMVLEPVNSERAKVAHRGAIDRQNVRRGVIDHMEGGDKPYLLRRDKYNVK
jgi:histidinol phosphatase-like PHP family hydrolase/DNA repair ATPase RecN